ncbi:ATP-dependent zinc protease family protein [Acidiluteibacter ferrifornacis]|uniref:Peptidase n=1 Tax=Acidiluteibacter ferrifornacis TaxID=2692424 RepID=A0A6N9NLJ1_9FLAO|nr:RimK/LysX family protein [Acidiluteibacter ferrifornacis]NBG66823.1 peptidase [Acidiluteibacter ferrifornacis]
MAKKEKVLIGRVEIVDFPKLELIGIEAKIDTGAYSTALHCHKIWVEEIEGKEVLHFDILDPDHPEYSEKIFTSIDFGQKKVKSSNGRKEKRYIIKTKIKLAGKTYLTDVSLTDRQKMKYPVLIGRKLLKNGYLIDVSKIKIN